MALGFKGRFSSEQIRAYQKRLLTILFPTAPFLYDQRQTELIPGHAHTVISSSNMTSFLDTRRWFMVFSAFMVIFVIATTYVWYAHHHDIGHVVRQLDVKTLRV